MNKHIKSFETELSRRQVMIGAAGLSFAIALAAAPTPRCWPAERAGRR